MPKSVVSLLDFREMLNRYVEAFEKHDARKINEEGKEGDPIKRETIDEAVKTMKTLQTNLKGMCQQNVLAVKLKPR